MTWLLTLADIGPDQMVQVGGKGAALARLNRAGVAVPETLCVTVDAYRSFVQATGLGERILLELKCKEFSDMRWEELWDTALRIRRLFLEKPIPEALHRALTTSFQDTFGNAPLVVRSSASDEDAGHTSFAGLHESYVNVRGPDSAIEHVKRVWASLWSDAALLYRKELGLQVERSAMAVVVQRLIEGEASGILFTQSPSDPDQAVLEAVHGLNAALVDGLIEPDRWLFERRTGRLLDHREPKREQRAQTAPAGFELVPLPPPLTRKPPVTADQAAGILRQGLDLEQRFGQPQDIEWTRTAATLWVLQARPITTGRSEARGDERGWYLSLRRSLENLRGLRRRIEDHLIPDLIATADRLRQIDLTALSDQALGVALAERLALERRWVDIYWRDFIPFAHGMRLFGQIYNDLAAPEDPFEFIKLLARGELQSIRRNQLLESLADAVRNGRQWAAVISRHDWDALPAEILEQADAFLDQFGDASFTIHGRSGRESGRTALFRLVLQLAAGPPGDQRRYGAEDRAVLEKQFLARFEGSERTQMEDLLDLARTSYRLRDDDNIYLARIQAQTLMAREELERRIAGAADPERRALLQRLLAEHQAAQAAAEPAKASQPESDPETASQFRLRPRQMVGQPAGPGLAQGLARVVIDPSELMDFQRGEILVCDAVTPMMTFVAPLAAAVVERRGGMLIHGAIIAREYGLPCVTGIPAAATLIHTGDHLSVDGYLGIVTVSPRTESAAPGKNGSEHGR